LAAESGRGRGPARIAQGLDWRWRWTLRRWGVHDGRKRLPDPLTVVRPLRTGTRRLLEDGLRAAVESVGIRYDEMLSPKRATLDGLDMRIAQNEDLLAATRVELTAHVAQEPPADPTRHLAIRRIARLHRRRLDVLRRRCEALTESLSVDRQNWAHLLAEIADLERRKVAEAQHLRAVYTHAEQIYNVALVRRHPEGDIIHRLLDTSAFRLPAWAEPEEHPRMRTNGLPA
jgi:hypothetical protein